MSFNSYQMKKSFNKINNLYISFILIGIITLLHIDIILAPLNQYLCNFEIIDLTYYINIREYAFNCIKSGYLPLWTTKIFCGIPFLANAETAIFYLPNILFSLLPISKAINFSFLLHFFILSFSVFLWIHNKTKDKFISLIVAIIAVFNSSFYLHFYAAHLSNITTMAWFPLLLYFYDKAYSTKSYSYIVHISFIISLQIFSGHLQYVYYSALTSLLYVIFFCRNKKVFITIFLSYLISIALTFVQLLPSFDFYLEGSRKIGLSNAQDSFLLLKPNYLLTLLFPTKIPFTLNLFWETSNYIGVLNFFIVLLAIFHIHNKQILKFLFIVLLLYSLTFNPISKIAENIIPCFSWFRGYIKLTFFANILLFPILAYGIRFILSRKLRINLLFIIFLLSFSVLIILFKEKISFLTTYQYANSTYYALKVLSILVLFFSVLLLLKKHSFFSMIIIFLFVIEPIIVMRSYSKPITIEDNYKNNYKHYNISKSDLNKQPRFYLDKMQNLKYDTENVLGSFPEKLKNYLSFYLKKKNDNIWKLLRCNKNNNLNRINVFFDYKVETNKEKIYKDLFDESFNIFNTVILEKEPQFKPQTTGEYTIKIISFNENSIEFECNTTEPAIIMYTDNYARGWKAYNIENPKEKYKIICADYIYKAISINQGNHKIRFEYKPLSFIIGMWISIISWIIFMFFAFLLYYKKKTKNKLL